MPSLSSSAEIIRVRPAMGTYVRIAVSGLAPDKAMSAIDDAFAAIERIEALMSFHRSDSQLHKLHRTGLRRWVPISKELHEVLALSKRLFAYTVGAFDPSIGGELMHEGLLPIIKDLPEPDPNANFSHLALCPGRARLNRPMLLDLGGIAKGYAVDRALAVLRRARAAHASVNAGGDLARFGAEESIALQHPVGGHAPIVAIKLTTGAMATSNDQRVRLKLRTRATAPLRSHASHSDASPSGATVTVIAKRCAIADGLTKVAWLYPDAESVLRRFGARALRVQANGQVSVLCE